MKIKFILLATILFFMVSGVIAMAQDTGTADDSLIGIVSVTRDEAGKVISATLETETYNENDEIISLSYDIELNEKGKELANSHDGDEVKVNGTISNGAEGQASKITISSYEASFQEEPVYNEEDSLNDEVNGTSNEDSFYEVPEDE